MVSATLPERYAAVVRARGKPTRSACVRYGTRPDAPADFTTLLVAYDIALSFTIGVNGASSSTSRNDARACSPRLSTPSATEREADGQRGRAERDDLAQGGEEVVGVGDDEPPDEHGEDGAQDAGSPAGAQVHCRSIVGRA